MRKSNGRGGGDISNLDPKYAGRWAGDEVYLVGDYDESDLYEKAGKEFTNISQGRPRQRIANSGMQYPLQEN